jgi:hypothetical protein
MILRNIHKTYLLGVEGVSALRGKLKRFYDKVSI